MDKIYIVMNYVEHDLKSLMETMKQPFLPGETQIEPFSVWERETPQSWAFPPSFLYTSDFCLPGEVKTLMIQLLRGVKHLHDNWILHRDLKTSNLLLSHAGILKVSHFRLLSLALGRVSSSCKLHVKYKNRNNKTWRFGPAPFYWELGRDPSRSIKHS